MGLEVIYIVRHGFRINWSLDSSTGTYSSTIRTPTGIPSDPALASYGVLQSKQLATHLLSLSPSPDIIYSSPYYRCLQTLAPYTSELASLKAKHDESEKSSVKVWIEPGLGEFYGRASFTHPGPAGLEDLKAHFDHLHADAEPVLVPDKQGEGIPQLHDRVAYVLDRIIRRADADPKKPRAILVCTHAAAVIAMGRALTGRMPEDISEEDFRCFTCGVSEFRRRNGTGGQQGQDWDPKQPDQIPDIGWRDGKGVAGGWDCERNSDCSFLENGEERGWNFYMEKKRIKELEEAAATEAAEAEEHTTSDSA